MQKGPGSPKITVIFGSNGQDGSLLLEQLESRGDSVLGLDVGTASPVRLSWDEPVAIGDRDQVDLLIKTLQPDEVYYLAAFHHSSEEIPDPQKLYDGSVQTNVTGLARVLDSIRRLSPKTRVFYAASSHVFGIPQTPTQDEATPLQPRSIYAMTKVFGLQLCRHYRDAYRVFAAVGILYNHESPRRGPQFLSKKVVSSALRIQRGLQTHLTVGNLAVSTDWGYAPEYVEAMTRILALPKGDDFVVASGRSHTVGDFVALTFEILGMDWRKYVREEPGLLARANVPLIGNAEKLFQATGWRATTDLRGMIQKLIAAESITINQEERKT